MTLEAWLAEIRKSYHSAYYCPYGCGVSIKAIRDGEDPPHASIDASYDSFHRVAVIVCAECGAFIDEIDAPAEPGAEESIRY